MNHEILSWGKNLRMPCLPLGNEAMEAMLSKWSFRRENDDAIVLVSKLV